MNKEELEKRIEETREKAKQLYVGHSTTLKYEDRLEKLEELYDNLYGF